MAKKQAKPQAKIYPLPEPEDGCICRKIPAERSGIMISADGEPLLQFHLDCPIHGIVVTVENDAKGEVVA